MVCVLLCFVFCIQYFASILCSKANVRAHLSLVCLVQLPGLTCYRIIVLLLLNKINDDDDDDVGTTTSLATEETTQTVLALGVGEFTALVASEIPWTPHPSPMAVTSPDHFLQASTSGVGNCI